MTTKPTPVAWALQGTAHIEAGEKRDYHDGQEWCALYDGAAIEAAVAAERERWRDINAMAERLEQTAEKLADENERLQWDLGELRGRIAQMERDEGKDVAAERERWAREPAAPAERALRRMLALRSGIPGLYCDDGEASGIEHGISIDFMREPVADIEAKLLALNVARFHVAQQAGGQ